MANLICIPHIFLWKVQQEGNAQSIEFVYQAQKPLIATCLQYIIEAKVFKNLPHCHSFYSQLLTFVNRWLVLKTDQFMNEIVQGEVCGKMGYQFERLLAQWISKMDLIIV
jgi:hypothetical protein